MRRGRLLFWIAFAMLFAQQGALLHAFSHAAVSASGVAVHFDEASRSARGDDSTAPMPGKICDQCLAFAQIGAALPSLPFVLFDRAALHAHVSGESVLVAPAAVLAYQSRAPPRLV